VSARQESFALVPETCPAVDSALEDAARLIKKQTESLRDAITESIQRAIDAENTVTELEDQVSTLKDRIAELEAEIAKVNDL
jgi:ubiquinone biosynthesis protein UbiJ